MFFNTVKKLGFTMIELLIVIAVLGILAVAVLSAINPIEQINRGRDTGSRSDAEQVISAVDRFYASQGFYPWQYGATSGGTPVLPWTQVDAVDAWVDTNAGGVQNVLEKLSSGSVADPNSGTNELKSSFINRIVSEGYNYLYVYNQGGQGDSTYACFNGKSQSFQTEARERCEGTRGSMPTDLDAATIALICGACASGSCDGVTVDSVAGQYLTCLP